MRINALALLIIFPFFGCESEDAAPASVNCGVGTRLGGDGNACVPVLGEGVELNTEGVVIATGTVNGETDEEAYNRGFAAGESSVTQVQCAAGTELSESGDCQPTDEFRQSAFDEGAASVTPLNCGEGTEPNDAGDACQPTMAYRDSIFAEGAASITVVTCAPGTGLDENGTQCIANLGDLVEVDAETGTIRPTQAALDAAREAGRLAGVASVTPLNCADGTAVNGTGDACVPTAEFRAAAVEEGRLAGVASVTPLNCADGTAVNDAGDACEPNLAANAEVAADGTIQASTAALDAARLAGIESVEQIQCGEGTVLAAGRCVSEAANDVGYNWDAGPDDQCDYVQANRGDDDLFLRMQILGDFWQSVADRYGFSDHTGVTECFNPTQVDDLGRGGVNYDSTYTCNQPYCRVGCSGFSYRCTFNTTENVRVIAGGCSGFDGYTCTVNASSSVEAVSLGGSGTGSVILNYQSDDTDRSGVSNSVQQNFTGN